jgi:hypothetical protein
MNRRPIDMVLGIIFDTMLEPAPSGARKSLPTARFMLYRRGTRQTSAKNKFRGSGDRQFANYSFHVSGTMPFDKPQHWILSARPFSAGESLNKVES